ncbi:MAG: hypothetical protein IPG89_14215 [Bacteroidetes bacterium]|nr:hypothetical protein [Bacteroidota bacterium]
MKKIILMISVIALITGTSCKSKEKASKDESSTTSTSNTKNVQSDKKHRFIVSFFSIGTGLDSDAYTKFENFVKNHPSKPAYDSYRWGREGEVDIVFNLKEFKKAADQTKFIEELKKAIGDSDRVRYSENETTKGQIVKKVQ